MRQFASVSSAPASFSCPSCRFTTQFCPCCGKYLTGSAPIDATNGQCLHNSQKLRGSHHAHHLKTSNSSLFSPLLAADKTVRQSGDRANVREAFGDSARAFSVADQDVIEWAQKQLRLPRRPLSAFEVFCHEAITGVDEHTSGGAAMPDAQVDVCTRSSSNMNRADLNPREEDVLRQRRILAQKWFYADRQLREECEKRAKVWSDLWTNSTHVPVAAVDAVGAATTMPPSQHSAGSTAQHLSNASSSLSPDPLLAKNSGEGSHKDQISSKKRDAKLNVCVTSYQLFRAANKGKFSSQIAAVQAWRALSPGSKAPFDKAAAELRVQRLLQVSGGTVRG
ncbi:unnamed protein product [Phytomonas sp. EM1]|nr:unnamed protein product [Phytomonas sp. EM1]|eukprot:CCW62930.1 unnamed protein product [Phytomonas sp. isolate EM1]